jgi:hypothetical protein
LLKKSIEDANAALRANPEGPEKNMQPFLSVLQHASEHYGLLVAYYRANGLVPPDSRPKNITLDPKVLSQYAGTYEPMAGTNFLITLEGNQLSVKLTGQPTFPVFPESETMFFLKVVDAQIEFVKDSSGAVTHLVLHQGGRDQKAPRISTKVELPRVASHLDSSCTV